MRIIIAALLLIVLGGCRQESNSDLYLAAVNKYLACLDAAEASGSQIEPPPKPAYLVSPVQPEPFPFITGTGFSTGTMQNTAGTVRLSTRSQADCEQTNTARKHAYEKAIRRYEKVISNRDSREANTGS